MTIKSYAINAGAIVILGAGATAALGSGGLLAAGTAVVCTAAKCGFASQVVLSALTGLTLMYGTQGAVKASEALSEFLIDCAVDVASTAKRAMGKLFSRKVEVYSVPQSNRFSNLSGQVGEALIAASAAA